jgi:squalene-hopene/tetraprenyl-beta-curcumene cyclase
MNRIALTVGFVLVVGVVSAQQEPLPTPDPGKNNPKEPVAAAASPAKAAEFLDNVALNWTRVKKCGTCHTNLPYLWARPSLKAFESPASGEIRAFFEKLADTWDPAKPPRKFLVPGAWEAQLVATAVGLAVNDSKTTGRLHPATKKALDRMWTFQNAQGGWNWVKCDWPPLEYDEYFGALYVAIGVGHAPDNYAASDSARAGVQRLREYFKSHAAPDLHHRIMLLWASTKLEGLVSGAEREATLNEFLALQKEDGGWRLSTFGQWKRHDDTPNPKDGPCDGYATGLAITVARAAGVPADHPQLRRGVTWLKKNQRESGRWFTESLSIDEKHFLTNVGTAYAVLALDACGELPK